jgi:hypothetical protein
MPFQKVLIPLACAALLYGAYHYYAWPGVAVATGALVMWILLHFTRMVQVLTRAAHRPMGYVDSAVMLNAKLRPGMSLLHVVAMTRALGALQSAKDAQPEVYRWTDASQSHVTCEFTGGKLKTWALQRPLPADQAPDALAAAPSAAP